MRAIAILAPALIFSACAQDGKLNSTGFLGQDDIANAFAQSVADGAFDKANWSDVEFTDSTAEKLAALNSCKTDTVERIRENLWGLAWRCEGDAGRPGALLTFDGNILMKVHSSMVQRQYSANSVSTEATNG